jgi:hypothetical protein
VTAKYLTGAWVTDPVVADDDWRKLEAAADLTFLPEHRNRIRNAIIDYNDGISIWRQSPRLSSIRPLLDEIAAKAIEFDAALAKLTASKQGRYAQKALTRWREFNCGSQLDLSEARILVHRWAKDAAETSAVCAEDMGAEGDPYLTKLLLTLNAIFKAAGGRGLYTSRSLCFLLQAARLAGSRINSGEALAQHLKRNFGRTPR